MRRGRRISRDPAHGNELSEAESLNSPVWLSHKYRCGCNTAEAQSEPSTTLRPESKISRGSGTKMVLKYLELALKSSSWSL